jgi:hypothetical protein
MRLQPSFARLNSSSQPCGSVLVLIAIDSGTEKTPLRVVLRLSATIFPAQARLLVIIGEPGPSATIGCRN